MAHDRIYSYWIDETPSPLGTVARLQKGDRVRVREGYEHAGEVGYYVGKSTAEPDQLVVSFPDDSRFWEKDYDDATNLLAAAIESFPYTREERIERAIEDYHDLVRDCYCDSDAALFAILDAGV